MLTHLAIILDGNRRWAKENNKTSLEGHLAGYENLKRVARYWFAKAPGGILTVYAFSTENWNRGAEEVGYLMKLFIRAMNEHAEELHSEGIRMKILGSRAGLSAELASAIEIAENKTRANERGTFNICLNYGGRDELVEAFQKITKQGIMPEAITKDLIANHLWTAGLPDPDLIIRTSGEQRLSNFLTWQSAYAEFYFSKKHWPAFTELDLDEAIADFEHRQRRFGGN